jgi:hypothetical protein
LEIEMRDLLTGVFFLKEKAGCDWEPLPGFQRIGIRKVWIDYDVKRALFGPDLVVSVSRSIGKAALDAGIRVKLNTEIKMFDWSAYFGKFPSELPQ